MPHSANGFFQGDDNPGESYKAFQNRAAEADVVVKASPWIIAMALAACCWRLDPTPTIVGGLTPQLLQLLLQQQNNNNNY